MSKFILGIESSCDDSATALFDIESFRIVYHRKITQELDHAKYGGVVPELAARLHTAALPGLLEELKPHFGDIVAIAVTNEPGLSVSLISGVSMAKALSIALDKPLIAVNHLIGHIYSMFLDSQNAFPMGVLLVSGGHTMVLDIAENGEISVLCATGDDSFGESFDKVAKMMGLGYPGGKIIENLAKNADNPSKFTIPLLHDKRLEYSFSGLKNAARIQISENLHSYKDIAAGFQNAAVCHIMDKLGKIYAQKKWQRFGVVGGASANMLLREKLEILAQNHGAKLFFAPLEYCSDNAAMIARAGYEKYAKGDFSDALSLDISPRSELKFA